MNKPFTDIDGKELEALIARVTEAKENNLALSPEDCQLLLDALLTLTSMQSRLADHGVTVHKLRKLLGIEKSSEKQSDVCKQSQGSVNKKRHENKKSDESDFTPLKPALKNHELTDVKKGAQCPECSTGKLYKTDPGTFLRITGQSPFTPEQHIMERLRCNTCGVYFTAALSEEVLKDGSATQK